MQRFAKQAAHSIVFIIGLVALLYVSSLILIPRNNGAKDGMQDSSANGILSEKANTIDVLILGDSESYSSMIPLRLWEKQGITAYCCGTPAQKLCYSEEFLHKTFIDQNPKVVILETNAIFRKFSLGNMIVHKADVSMPVFRYHDRWKSLKNHGFGLATKYTYINNAKGYKFTAAIEPADASRYMKPSSKMATIPSRNRDYIESIKSYCDEKGAELVLVSSPSTVNWKSSRHNSIDKLAKDLDIKYIDMNTMQDEIPIDWQIDTGDKGDHMNYYGAKKVTDYLGKYLSQMNKFTSHKKDDKYNQWEENLINFNKTVSNVINHN